MVVVLTLMAFSHTKPEDAGTVQAPALIMITHSLNIPIPILIPEISDLLAIAFATTVEVISHPVFIHAWASLLRSIHYSVVIHYPGVWSPPPTPEIT